MGKAKKLWLDSEILGLKKYLGRGVLRDFIVWKIITTINIKFNQENCFGKLALGPDFSGADW